MASQSQRIDGWPTILWIAWKAGEVEHEQPLCLAHRAQIFEHYPSAHGLRRRGDRCAMCLAHPPRTTQLHSPRDSTTPPGEPGAAESSGPREQGLRAAGLAHPARPFLSPGPGRGKTRRRRMRTNNGAPRTRAVERVAPIWRVPRAPSRPVHRGQDEAAGDALLQHGEDPRRGARIRICRDPANGSK